MNRKNLVWLTVAAVVVIVLAFFVAQQRISETRPAAGGGRMFDGLIDNVNSVSTIKVNNGKEGFTISRSEENWGIVEKSGYPVQYKLVKEVILGVAGLDLVAAKTKDPTRHNVLGLDVPGAVDAGGAVGLTLIDEKDTVLADLLVGNTIRAGDPRRYVRRPNEDQTWLGSGGVDVGREPLDWVETILTQIRHDRIRRVEYTDSMGDRAVLERQDRSGFKFTYLDIPDGMRSLPPSKINTISGTLAFLNFKDVRKEVDFDFGGDTVIETIFTTWDGLVVQVSTVEADGQHWAKFDAKFDEALTEPVDPPIGTNTSDDNAEEEIEDPHKAIREEVKAISVRAIGWAYLLDQNKLSQLRRGSESFIEPDVPDEEEDAGEVVPDQ